MKTDVREEKLASWSIWSDSVSGESKEIISQNKLLLLITITSIEIALKDHQSMT